MIGPQPLFMHPEPGISSGSPASPANGADARDHVERRQHPLRRWQARAVNSKKYVHLGVPLQTAKGIGTTSPR